MQTININRVNFEITLEKGYSPWNCCDVHIFKVKNFGFPLSTEQLSQLEKMGLLGSGQEFRVLEEWTEDFDAYNKYYCYRTKRLCDSGD